MKKWHLALTTCLLSFAALGSDTDLIKTSPTCFRDWQSTRGDREPTGRCKGSAGGAQIETHVEADFPSNYVFIRGAIHEAGQPTKWFRYLTSECQDIPDGWTTVRGIFPPTKEEFSLTHREVREIPPLGKSKKSFEGEAVLSMRLNGVKYDADMKCIRTAF